VLVVGVFAWLFSGDLYDREPEWLRERAFLATASNLAPILVLWFAVAYLSPPLELLPSDGQTRLQRAKRPLYALVAIVVTAVVGVLVTNVLT